jgi:hypothetical protein
MDVHRARLDRLDRRFKFAWEIQFLKYPAAKPAIKAHRRQATAEAIRAIYGAAGPPPGITEGIRHEQINRWLREHGRAAVSLPTIRRALRILAEARS